MSRAVPKRSAQRNAARRASPPRPGPLSRRTWWRMWSLIGWGVTLGAVAWGGGRLEQFVRERQAPLLCHLEWVRLPAWLKNPGNDWVLRGYENREGQYEPGIEDAAGLQWNTHILEPDLCARVGAGLSQSAWIEKVTRVTKLGNGTLLVDAVFREPVALVDSGDRIYLVDGQGVRLPKAYAKKEVDASDPNNPMLIVGVRAPVPEPGRVWCGRGDPNRPAPELAAGLKLVKYLGAAYAQGWLPFRSSLRAVEVGAVDARGRPLDLLRIRTLHPDCYIDWGLPPGEESGVDPSSAARKLEMLGAYYAKEGQLPELILSLRDKDEVKTFEPKRR